MQGRTLRLPDDLDRKIVAMARINQRPVAEELREAVAGHIARARSDPEFRRRAQASIQDAEEFLA